MLITTVDHLWNGNCFSGGVLTMFLSCGSVKH